MAKVKRTPMRPKSSWRTAALDPDAVIRVILDANPKKPGSKAHAKYAELRTGMTVADYLALEGQRPALDGEKRWPKLELLWCLHMRFITLDGPAAATTEPVEDELG